MRRYRYALTLTTPHSVVLSLAVFEHPANRTQDDRLRVPEYAAGELRDAGRLPAPVNALNLLRYRTSCDVDPY